MDSKLPPIDFNEDKSKYEAKEEVKDVMLKGCTHKQVKIVNGELRCVCGAGWSGGKLDELYKLLKG